MAKARGQAHAYQWLVQHIAEARRRGETELASAAVLSRLAGVSHVVLLRVMRRLHDEGVVVLRQGRRARLVTSPPHIESEEPTPRGTRWRSLARRLERRILQADPNLPLEMDSHKVMQAYYGVCYQTLKRALVALESKGLVVREGRGYRVVPFARRTALDTVVFIGRCLEQEHLAFMPPRGDIYLQLLDRVCAQAGVHVAVVPLFGKNLDSEYVDMSNLHDRVGGKRVIVGFVVLPTALPAVEQRLLPSLARYGVPVAVIDEQPVQRLPFVRSRADILWIHAVQSYLAGREVGRYLLELGHQKVGFICPFADRDWSRPRLQGLHAVYDAAGRPDAVVPFLGSTRSKQEGMPKRGTERLAERMARVVAGHEWGRRANDAEGQAADDFMARVTRPLTGSISWALRESLPAATALFDICTNALAHTEITAWVGSNTMAALIAYDFLNTRGRRVPQDISLVGFDDTLAAAARRLTTYSFNPESAVQLAARHLLGTRSHAVRHRNVRAVGVQGCVNARGSTGRAALRYG